MNEKREVSKTLGLTSQEVEVLLKKYGYNELVSGDYLTRFQQIIKILSDPMGLMLLGMSALYFFTGDRTDAVIVLIAYIPVTVVDVFLDLKSENALKALKSNLHMTAKVFRDGVLTEIATRLLVPGDVIAFEEGQSLPADGKIIEAQDLAVNESSLTGESLPIDKQTDENFFAGTIVLTGRGLGLIEQTGKETKFGKISYLLEKTQSEETPLQKKVNTLVTRVILLAVVLVVLLFIIEYFRGIGLMNSLIRSLTFGMAAIPEEFPLVFTLYLSLGALRLSKHGVLVKTLPSVEALGNVDVICTDKTGTLTEGKFSLVEVVPFGSICEEERDLITILACEPTPVDSMEKAITEKISSHEKLKENWKLIFDYPFEAQGKHMTHVWSDKNGIAILAMKGAVEGVLEHSMVSSSLKDEILDKVNTLASQGKRILGLATKKGNFNGDRSSDEKDLEFVGLLVFSDPIRSSAKKAINECQHAGIEVKMLTGDHYLTAHAIADELEIVHTDQSIFSGKELSTMTEEKRFQAYLKGSIFARVSPEQKYEMVKVLKANGKVVAMTGDGVNDSPALKLADIGVSMGENATDVARSTAKMILLKNNFDGIVQAIFEGRNIFANLRRSFSYQISFNIPVVLLAFLPPLLGWDQLFFPVHIILMELIVHPISAFAFENIKTQTITSKKNLIPIPIAITAILSGVLLSLFCLFPFRNAVLNEGYNHTRGMVIAMILYGNIGFTLVEAWPNIKSKRVIMIVVTLIILPVILCNVDFIGKYFYFEKLSPIEFFLALIAGVMASVPAFLIRDYRNS